jgi:RcsF protein
MKFLTTIFITTVLALTVNACSSNYSVSTNLDKSNFDDYFSHAQVRIVENESDFSSRYKLVGMIEGQSCQEKAHHAAPDEITARTDARRNAFQQQANAVIFTGCALIDDTNAEKHCHATLVCYAKAYQVESSSDE